VRCYKCGDKAIYKAYFKSESKTTIRFVCANHTKEIGIVATKGLDS
jgi:hypothetical protein